MVLKRHYKEEESLGVGEIPAQESKRRQTFETVVSGVKRGLSIQEFTSVIEPLLRKMVREELERVLLPLKNSFPSSSHNRSDVSGSRGFQLHFRTKLPHTVFTSNRIEAETGEPVQIVVLDAKTKRIVTTGPISSLKVEFLVLDGDFGSEANDWSQEEFDVSVIREREGKRPLVTGELQITLRDGVGYLRDITFTDNSSWTRSRTFRLGARVVRNSFQEEGIREARSEAFMVKDHRGELYKKHHPPSLGDEVWRLEKIGKDGAFHNRLTSNQIKNVQDLLRLLYIDPSYLRSILGNGMSNKAWDTIVEHAMSCNMDNKRYVYYSSGGRVGLMFNSVYKLIGATFDGQSCMSLENLTSSQMTFVETLKHHAYKNLDEMVEIEWPPVRTSSLVLPLEGSSFPASTFSLQSPEFPITFRGQSATHAGSTNALPYSLDAPAQLEDFPATEDPYLVHSFSSIQRNNFKMKGSLASHLNDLNQWASGESSSSVVMDGLFTEDNYSQVQMPEWFPVTPSWEHGNRIFLTSSGDEMGLGFISTLPDASLHMSSSSSNPKIRWLKIRAAVKCIVLARKVFAARRPRFMQLGY